MAFTPRPDIFTGASTRVIFHRSSVFVVKPEPQLKVYEYNDKDESFTLKSCSILEDRRIHFAVANHAGQNLIMSGGVRDCELLDSVFKFNFHTG